MKRVFLIVLDSFGVGEMKDSAEYGDAGSNTLRAVASNKYFNTPNMAKLGLFHLDGLDDMKKRTISLVPMPVWQKPPKGKILPSDIGKLQV